MFTILFDAAYPETFDIYFLQSTRSDKITKLCAPGHFQLLPVGVKLTGSCRYLNTAPLGHDQNGCEYWLIGCQETYTLGSFNKLGLVGDAASNTNSSSWTDPCVLVRDTEGAWHKYGSTDILALFNSLNSDVPCEGAVKNSLVDRLFAAKQRIYSGLYTYNNVQLSEWFANQRKIEQWLHHLHVNMNAVLANVVHNPQEIVRLMELVYARCCESRLALYCAALSRDDIARYGDPYLIKAERMIQGRMKRLRDAILEENAECHPLKGFQRNDSLGRMREISCCTMASRFLSDPSLQSYYQYQLRNVKWRSLDLESRVEVLEKSAEETVGDVEMQVEVKGGNAASDVNYDTIEMLTFLVDANDTPVKVAPFVSSPSVPVSTPSARPSKTTVRSRDEHTPKPVNGNVRLPSSHATKCVEQLDFETGEVVRRYASGKEAAMVMQVSQGGISQCCTGIRSDCYGFKWRFFRGSTEDGRCWKLLCTYVCPDPHDFKFFVVQYVARVSMRVPPLYRLVFYWVE